jgi:hypothetical protein
MKQPIGGTFDEWVAWWEFHLSRKVPGSSWRPFPGSQILFDPEKGFLEYGIDAANDGIMIHAMCGDGRFWEEKANEIAKTLGYSKAFFFVRRDPRTYMRKYGAKIHGFILEREVR